jgi:bifunctional non-homologous end joining protein LigD
VWPARTPRLAHPDLCVIDLDPADEDHDALRAAVLAVRDVLGELGCTSWVKTSGSKGFHVVVPLDRGATFATSSALAEQAAGLLVERHPDRLTQAFSKADRGGRILVDTGRNRAGATFAAAYAVRARPGAPVSAPCTWDEIEAGAVHPRSFTLRSMPDRVAKVGDLWSTLHAGSKHAGSKHAGSKRGGSKHGGARHGGSEHDRFER